MGIKPFAKRGGEAVVQSSSIDSKGNVVYTVTLLRNGRSRTVYREDLIVHRQATKKGRRKTHERPARRY